MNTRNGHSSEYEGKAKFCGLVVDVLVSHITESINHCVQNNVLHHVHTQCTYTSI